MDPLVSVIIPVYNPGKHLIRCLDSIVNQTYKNLEIILIDDGSTDGSGAVCDAYARNDIRITCIHQENQGVSISRNIGLEMCKGEYIHFPDSDDYIAPETYEFLIKATEDCDVVVFEYNVEYPDRIIQHTQPDEQYGLFDNANSVIHLFTGFQFVCTKFFKKALSEGLKFRTDIYRGEDTLFAAQILSKAEKVKFISNPFYYYVQSNESATRGVFRPSQLTILKLYEAYETLLIIFPKVVLDRCVCYLHDCVIGIYYDMWSDKNKYSKEKKTVRKYLKKYYRQACVCARNSFSKRVKFFLATWFPNLFCVMHKLIHRL